VWIVQYGYLDFGTSSTEKLHTWKVSRGQKKWCLHLVDLEGQDSTPSAISVFWSAKVESVKSVIWKSGVKILMYKQNIEKKIKDFENAKKDKDK